jgi:7-cyano-7-deazaguanine synthase in queuosine biosynthesis
MEPKTYIDFKDREYGGKDKFADFDDVDTIIPHGGGLESMAALAWAVDTGRKPLVWTDLIADRSGTHNLVLGARKSANYFKVPFILSTNTIPMKSINFPAGFINIDNIVKLIVGNPQWKIKEIVFGTNTEDSGQQRGMLKNIQRNVEMVRNMEWDIHGLQWEKKIETPIMIFPFEHNTKSEIYSFIQRKHPTLIDFAWTCMTPIQVEDDKRWLPCGKCSKCIEYKAAKQTAENAWLKVKIGKNYKDLIK